jgi:hypothetical protein
MLAGENGHAMVLAESEYHWLHGRSRRGELPQPLPRRNRELPVISSLGEGFR